MIIKVSKNTVIFFVIGFIILATVIVTAAANPGQRDVSKAAININNNGANSVSISKLKEQTAKMGAVEVDVSVKKLGSHESSNIFSVNFNTHSVELDFDFTEIITLSDDLGNIYKATEWTGNRGWHHVSGDIIFPSIDSQASEVILTIMEIEGLERSFEWSVDN